MHDKITRYIIYIVANSLTTKIERDISEGSVAERSKALVLGTSPKGRGFESHRCQFLFFSPLKIINNHQTLIINIHVQTTDSSR